MRILFVAMLCAALLGGCLTNNEITSADDGRSVNRDAGVILIGIDGPAEISASSWLVEVRKVNPATGELERYERFTKPARFAQAVWKTGSLFSSTKRYFAHEVVPGDYALTVVGAFQDGGSGTGGTYTVYQTKGEALASVGFLTLMAVTGAVGREVEEAKFGKLPRPPYWFTDRDSLVPDAPRFRIGAGEVVYIGDFKLGADIHQLDGHNSSAGGPGTQLRDATVLAPFVQYQIDDSAARRAAGELGLRSTTIRIADLGLPAEPVGLSPRLTPERIEWAKQTTILSTRRVHAPTAGRTSASIQSAAPQPAPRVQPASTSGTSSLSGLSSDELRRLFLSGEISMEEYNKARAGQ